jgi:hypothetical protein
MYKGDYKLGSVVSYVFRHKGPPLDISDIRIAGQSHKPNQKGVNLEEDYLDEKGLYRLNIDTSAHPDYFSSGDFTILVDDLIMEFSLENRYQRGTDEANTIIPDKAGIRDVQWANLVQSLEGIIVLLNSRAPAHEYDKQLDCDLSSRSPAAEYDEQLDKKLSSLSPAGEYLDALVGLKKSLSPKGEYDAVLAACFDIVYKRLDFINKDTNKVVEKLPRVGIADFSQQLDMSVYLKGFTESLVATLGNIINQLTAMSGTGGVTLASEQPNYAPALAGVPVEVSQDVLDAVQSLIMDIRVFDPNGVPDVSCAWIEAMSYLFADWRNLKEVYGNKIVLHKNTGEELLERELKNDGVKVTHGKWRT